jgi:MFS family permease
MLFGLTASLLGVLLFAIAPSVLWLFVGRALMGIGVGLSVGPSTAAMVEFGTDAQVKRAASVTAIAQAFGFAAALLVGGALTQYAPWPMHLSFWVLLVLLGGLFVAVWLLPRQVRAPAAGTWRPRTPSVPSVLRPPFAIAALAVTTAYTHGVLVLSLGGQVAHDLVGSPNAFLNGAVLALFAIASALAGAMTRRLSPSLSMILGAVASAVGMTLLALSIAWHGVWLFLAANVMTGIGYGLLFLGGLALLNAVIPAQHRGGVLSTLYLFAYLALGVVALGLGVVATHTDLGLAVDLGAGIVALLSLAVIVILVVRRKGSFLSDTAFL